MADNVVANPGAAGATFATDDIGGVQYPRTKVNWGADGSTQDVAAGAAALPIQDGGNSISVDDGTGSLTVDGTVTITDGGATISVDDGGTILSVDDGGGSLTIDGTVTTSPPSDATTNVTKWAGTAVDVNSGAKSAGTVRVVIATDQPQLTNKLLVTPDSVALPANQSVNNNQVVGTTIDVNSGNKSAGTQRVVLATDQPALTNKLLVTPDSVALPANQSVNVNQVAGTTTDTNSGNKSAGTQRIVIATDQPQLTNALKVDPSGVTSPVSGTVTANQGTAAAATAGWPVIFGRPTSAALSSASISAASSGENTLVSGTSSQTIRVFKIFLVAAAAVDIKFKDAAGGTDLTGVMSLLANGSFVLDFDTDPWFTTASSGAFILNLSAAVQVSGRVYYIKS